MEKIINDWIKNNHSLLVNERLAWLKKINAKAWYCPEFERVVHCINNGTLNVTDNKNLGSRVFTRLSEYNEYIEFWTEKGPVYFQPYASCGPFLSLKKPWD